jgi:NAD(P)H dehydrogenase (quinone)
VAHVSCNVMILITGASGRVARRSAELLASGGRALRLMTRTPGSVARPVNAEVVYGDFAEPASLDSAFAGVTTALIVSGFAAPGARAQMHRNAFDAAARAHVQHVVYLSLQGASPSSKYPFSRDHALSEQYLAASRVPFTVLRNAFYLDMFLEMFDAAGVIRGPSKQGRGAFVSREDCARIASAVLTAPPGGTYDVTGPEALSLTDVARRLSVIVGRELRYEDESVEKGRERRSRLGEPAWRVELSLGWHEAIAAGELERISDAVLRFTGNHPLDIEMYFSAFSDLLRPMLPRLESARDS